MSFRSEFTKGRNYFDLLRATAGGLAIIGGLEIAAGIGPESAGADVPFWPVQATQLAIVTVGLLVQMVRFERSRLALFAPIFYLAGLSVSLCSPGAALFAFILIWALNPLFRSPRPFLGLYGLVAAGFGLLLGNLGWELPLAAFLLCFLPVLLSLLARRPLVVFTRKSAAPAATGA